MKNAKVELHYSALCSLHLCRLLNIFNDLVQGQPAFIQGPEEKVVHGFERSVGVVVGSEDVKGGIVSHELSC